MSGIFDFFRKKTTQLQKEKKTEKHEPQIELDEITEPSNTINFCEEDIKIPTKFNKQDLCSGHRQRLRNKILENNPEHLMDYELLEALLIYAIPRSDVKPIAKHLLNEYTSLKKIFLSPYEQYKKIPGIGSNTLCFFKIIHEIYSRFERENLEKSLPLNSPDKVAKYCQARMAYLNHEQFRVLFLNRKNHLIKDLVIQNGTIDKAAVFPRELITQALTLGSSGMILVHNHPSGDATPSQADIDLTMQIKKAASPMDIAVFDHIIIGKNEYYSIKNSRLSNFNKID